MRRLIAITAFALLLAVPVWAQRGGGHMGGGGGHAGGFGGHVGGAHFGGGTHMGGGGGHIGGGHLGGMRSGIGSRGSIRSSRSSFRQPFLHDGFRGRFHHRDHDWDDRFFVRNRCFGWNCGGWGWGYPWWGLWDWWDNHSSSYDEDYYRNLAAANEMNQQSLEEQRLRRQEEADGDRDAYMPRSSNMPAAASANTANPVIPPTVLVFRDGHRQEIQNYAIVAQTLWDFAPQRNQKISLAVLDLDATTKANDERGVTFRLPASSEAQ